MAELFALYATSIFSPRYQVELGTPFSTQYLN
jgi:hypothetical protein